MIGKHRVTLAPTYAGRLARRARSRAVGLLRAVRTRIDRGRVRQRQLIYRLRDVSVQGPTAAGGSYEVYVIRTLREYLESKQQAVLSGTTHLGSHRDICDQLTSGHRLYALVRRDIVLCSLWATQPQAHNVGWYVPLCHKDVVLFKFHTHPEWRGMGLIGVLLNHAIYNERSSGAAIFTDCSERNNASRRAIERAGFVLLGTVPSADQFAVASPGNARDFGI